ncbi:MAG: hypothetical protein GF332_03135 [Candidatus Moranbacteria bacterium]|nr:hypothetical protein [Candidatus Moranbacteria bacterium]
MRNKEAQIMIFIKTSFVMILIWLQPVRSWAEPLFAEAPDLSAHVLNIMNFLIKIVAMIGVGAFVVSGIMYLAAGGNQEMIERAKKYVFYSIIGLVLAIGALVIIRTIGSLLEGA